MVSSSAKIVWAPLVAKTVKNLPASAGVRSLGGEDPLEKGMATHSIFLPGESHGQVIVYGVAKSWT